MRTPSTPLDRFASSYFSRLASLILMFAFLGLYQAALGQSTIVQQDFDGSTPEWEYASNVAFFSHKNTNTQNDVYPAGDGWNDDGFYGLLDETDWDGNISLSAFSDSVLAIHDLEDEGDFGTDKTAKVTFERVNISGYSGVDITFDYELVGLGSSDNIEYEVYEDGVEQGKRSLSGKGSITYNIGSNVSDVRLVLYFKQNGTGEYVAIDNIKLEGNLKSQNEPANQPASFSANALSNGKVKLSWNDASGSPAPDGYLIKAEQSSSISAPSDGTDPSIDKDLSDGSAVVKVGQSTGGSYTFDGLNRNTSYDFQIWSFTNAAGNIDFLTSPAGPAASATTLANKNLITESFETTSGYTFPNGRGGSGEDFFDRTDIVNGPATADYVYAGFDQDHFVAGEDINGVSGISDTGQVKLSGINIAGYRNLKVKGAFAAGNSSGYESADYIAVEARIDGGNWATVLEFEGNSNGKLSRVSGGAILKGAFQDFIGSISGSGSNLDIRIISELNAGDEEAAFDNIRVSGKAPKKWDGGASDNNWSSADNWKPNGVPGSSDVVVLDDTYVSADYTVSIDGNLSSTSIQSLEIRPAANQAIEAVRQSGLNTFKLTTGSTALTIGSGGQYTDESTSGIPAFPNNGEVFVKQNGRYRALSDQSSTNTGAIVSSLAPESSPDGTVIYETDGQRLSASGQTYPTSLSLKIKSSSTSSGQGNEFTTTGSGDFTIEGDLTIGSKVTYKGDPTATNPRSGDLVVKGHFTNNGTLNLNSSKQTLKLTSASQQTLESTSNIGNLTVDNPAGVQLNQTLTINNSLTLTNGNVTFQNSSDKLIIADGGTVTGASQSSYVDGTVRKIGDEAFDFPVGANGNYAKIGISAPANSSDTFEATYFAKGPGFSSLAGSGKNPASAVLQQVSQNQFWDLERGKNSSSAVDVTLYWNNQTNGGIQNKSSLVVAHETTISGTPKWENLGKDSTNGSATGTGSITKNNVNNFSDFTFGSTSNSNPLPVELLHFSASVEGDRVALNWATASETNNKHFQVQKQVEGEWENIGTVKGNGTTIEKQTYDFRDGNVQPGRTYYYRLKQVDFDGSYEYSDVKAVAFEGAQQAATPQLSLHPNPVADQLSVEFSGSKENTTYQVQIRSSRGEVVYREALAVQQGRLSRKLPVSALQPGAYVLTLQGAEQTHHKRFIKQ